MLLIARMAGDTIHASGLVNICLESPVVALFSFTVEAVTGPSVLVVGSPDNLKMEIFKIGNLLFCVIHLNLISNRVFGLIF